MDNQEYNTILKSEREVHDFFDKINLENGSNYKIKVIEEFKNSKLLKLIFLMAYDRVNYLYGMSLNSLQPEELDGTDGFKLSLEDSLNYINTVIVTRELTGNAAIESVNNLLKGSSKENARIIRNIIDRNLKMNTGTTSINKVHKNLIKKPVYMRCSTYNDKTAKKIKYPALVQLKADGLACFTHVTPNEVICYTRSGETFKLNSIQYLSNKRELHNKIIQGELLIEGELDRAISNGEINSLIKFRQGNNSSIGDNDADNIESRLLYEVWDIITESEWLNAQNKIKCNIPYKERFEEILGINWTNENI